MNKELYYCGLVTVLYLLSCTSGHDTANTTETKVDSLWCLNEQLRKTTVISAVEEMPIVEQLTLSGKIEYNENDLVAFRSLLEGTVESVQFELGDYVKHGDVLATVKSVQIQELVQQQRYYKSQVELLDKQLSIKRALLEDGLASSPEILEIEHQLASAHIELDRIAETLSLYRSVGEGSFQVLAPKNGYIIQKSISPGQTVSTDGDPLFSISNLKEVWVMVNIYANNMRHIKTGDAVRVRTIAYPDQYYPGKIDKIYNVFDDNEHVLKARVVLPNLSLNLMPGLSADIIIDKKGSNGAAFAIPNNAIVFNDNNEYVVVYREDCDMEVRQITRVASNEEHTFVRETFGPQEKVLSTNALLFFEQLKP